MIDALFVVVPLVVVALVVRGRSTGARLERAAKAPTWAPLTGGELTVPHEGSVTSFWASGHWPTRR